MPDEPDQNALSDPAVPGAADSEEQNGPPPAADGGGNPRATITSITSRHPDPTRYGDWEKGGRCIDF